MLIKVPFWFNSVLFIYPSYGPWKSVKSSWIWFWQMGKIHVLLALLFLCAFTHCQAGVQFPDPGCDRGDVFVSDCGGRGWRTVTQVRRRAGAADTNGIRSMSYTSYWQRQSDTRFVAAIHFVVTRELVHNRFSKTETSFGFRFQCVNGLHETGFYANMQTQHVTAWYSITTILQLLFNENQEDVLWNDVCNSTMHDCFITQNSQTFFSQSVVNIINQRWIWYVDQAYIHVKQWCCQTISYLPHTHTKISAMLHYYLNI